jgi:NAD(P)-dependent dehydrogenase (short-subunit alcohol dehydrogenase family)
VTRLSHGRIDAIIANAGGGPPEKSLQLNFFGAVATLDGLRPLLKDSAAPRAVAVSSIASLRPPYPPLVEACLRRDEAAGLEAVKTMAAELREAGGSLPPEAELGLAIYGNAKQALQRWCRKVAATAQWAGSGVALNVVALGFYDTPAAAYVLNDPASRSGAAAMVPLRDAFPGQPDEAAALLAWCVSAENAQMTGQILFADGGFEAKALTA